MRKLLILAAIAGLILASANVSVAWRSSAPPTVSEEITGSTGDWTYTYTLTNHGNSDIYHWAVWFPTDPAAVPRNPLDSVSADTTDWVATDLTDPYDKGFFPEEYTDYWNCHVYDSSGNDLAGPKGEPGFYYTIVNEYYSNNPGEYWDGSAWLPLPDPMPDFPDPIYDVTWRGEYFGWDGSGADIQTNCAISPGGTGQLIIHSTAVDAVTGQKSFSFSTTDYCYSYYDCSDESDHFDFESSGTVGKRHRRGFRGYMH